MAHKLGILICLIGLVGLTGCYKCSKEFCPCERPILMNYRELFNDSDRTFLSIEGNDSALITLTGPEREEYMFTLGDGDECQEDVMVKTAVYTNLEAGLMLEYRYYPSVASFQNTGNGVDLFLRKRGRTKNEKVFSISTSSFEKDSVVALHRYYLGGSVDSVRYELSKGLEYVRFKDGFTLYRVK